MPYVQFKDLDMFYEKMGVGEPVLFLHSGYSRGFWPSPARTADPERDEGDDRFDDRNTWGRKDHSTWLYPAAVTGRICSEKVLR